MQKLCDIVNRSIYKTDGQQQPRTDSDKRKFTEDCESYDAEVSAAKAEIFKMVSLMPAPGTEQDIDTSAALYWDILKGELSPKHIASACRSAMRGQVTPSSGFRPLPGVLISYANTWFQRNEEIRRDPRMAISAPLQIAPPEHKRLGREYGDEQFKADEKERIGRKFRLFADELRATTTKIADEQKPDHTRRSQPIYSRQDLKRMDAGEREKQKIAAEAYLESIRDKPLPPLSAELRKILGASIPRITE